MLAATLGLVLLAIQQRAGVAADATLDAALAATGSAIDEQLAARSRALARLVEGLAQVPTYASRVSAALAAASRTDLLDQADEFRAQSGAEWALLTDAAGVLQADTHRRDVAGDSLGGGALVGLALEGRTAEGAWVEPGPQGDRLFQAVAVPVRGDAGLAGVLVVALPVDSALAAGIRRTTGSEVVFFARDSLDRAHPVAGTLPAAVLAAPLAAATADTGARRIRLDAGEAWVGTVGALRTAGGYPVAGYTGLRNRDAELARYRDLERTVLLVGLGGLLLGSAASLALARQLAAPVNRLAALTRALAEGRETGTITRTRGDEIGDLEEQFGRLLAELREQERLVAFLTTGTGRTVASPAEAPTMVTSSMMVPGGTFAGRYRIEALLGMGGMGIVYRATDLELGERVAIKTLKAEAMADPALLERFKQEIRLARRISHRNVVRTHDLGEHDGLYFITMEYVEGTTLSDLIRRRGRLPVDVTLTVGKQLLRALEVAHEEGVVHRDIKPQNLVVDPSGLLKVMDFGIARLSQAAPAGQSGLTAMGTIIGTPEYMAPEQLMAEEVDGRADLYAAGCVLYECLTGAQVFQAPTVLALANKVLTEPPPDPRLVDPTIPEALAGTIRRALAKDRAQRYQTATEMREAL
ncbi:MAG: protein kinase [Gemmatimonadales bacterium]|nr:protein kinase [Gemmatimonadales bacterium]